MPTTWTAPQPPSVVAEPPQPIDDPRGAGVAGVQEQMAHARGVRRDGVVANGVGDERPAGGLGHLDHRRPATAGIGRQEPPLGLGGGAERSGYRGELRGAPDRVEEAFATIGHRDLVGGPSGPPRRAAHGCGDLRGRGGAPELVGCGDQV